MTDTQHDYCHEHGGWGSDTIPCRVCGSFSPPNTMPTMPDGLTWNQAFTWGAEQITKQLTKRLKP